MACQRRHPREETFLWPLTTHQCFDACACIISGRHYDHYDLREVIAELLDLTVTPLQHSLNDTPLPFTSFLCLPHVSLLIGLGARKDSRQSGQHIDTPFFYIYDRTGWGIDGIRRLDGSFRAGGHDGGGGNAARRFSCVGGVGRGCIGGWLCWLGREARREKCNLSLSLSLSLRELGEGAYVGAHFS